MFNIVGIFVQSGVFFRGVGCRNIEASIGHEILLQYKSKDTATSKGENSDLQGKAQHSKMSSVFMCIDNDGDSASIGCFCATRAGGG